MKHPYVEYEASKLWTVVKSSIEELVENNDVELQTPIEYVVGYICRNISLTNMPVKDILQELHSNKIREDDAHEIISQIMHDIDNGLYDQFRLAGNRVDLAAAYGMNKYEWTAYCQGAPLSIIAQWRYNGWPDKCCNTDKELNYKHYHWLVKKDSNGEYGLMLVR